MRRVGAGAAGVRRSRRVVLAAKAGVLILVTIFLPWWNLQAADMSWKVPAAGADAGLWKEAVIRTLKASLPYQETRLEVVKLELPGAATALPPGSVVTLSAPAGWMRTPRITLAADVADPDGSRRRLWVAARMEVQVPLVVSTTSIRRGETLSPDQFRMDLADLLALRGRRPLDMKALEVDLTARRNIEAGAPLTADLVVRTPVIRQGQRIGLVVRMGGITVRTTGIARRTAAAGDLIPISNAQTGKIINARVVDRRTAVVEVAEGRP
ncbi:MAG: flagellar basal body P-ring formation chaperone FlgA [Acidobacteriota bacterium]